MMLLDVKLLSSETDFRGLGVGTVLTTLTSSLRWLKGPRMIYTPTRMRKKNNNNNNNKKSLSHYHPPCNKQVIITWRFFPCQRLGSKSIFSTVALVPVIH